MRDWTYVETRKIGLFDVILEWCYEDLDLSHVFETAEDIAEHADRCNRYIDTHYVARVRVMYDDFEFGSDTLGSCYAYDCDPADDMKAGIGGYLDQMIDDAMKQARDRSVEMLDRLKRDFLGVDNATA
jgi:hypothetical protein